MNSISDFGLNVSKDSRREECTTHGPYLSRNVFRNMWSGCPVCLQESFEAERRAQERQRAEDLRLAWEKKIGKSGIPERFQDRTFESFAVASEAQRQALTVCSEYAKNFANVMKRGSCLLLVGRPGTGKTHLAAAIGMHAIREHRATVLFTTAIRACRNVKDTWSRNSEKSESEAIADLTYPDLLILDEVGIQFGSEAEKNILFDILNERYEKRRPTIFLSNLKKDDVGAFLGERVMDRMREDGGQHVPFTWDSYRGKA